MKPIKAILFVLLTSINVIASANDPVALDVDLDYYFGTGATFDDDIKFDANVPTPKSVLGYQVGEWHVRPEQIAEYMYTLAKTSNRVWVEEIGRTYEKRPLLLVSFSDQNNIKRLAEIKQRNADFNQRTINDPAVVWMGYSVHGNEASGANAAVLFAYYLAAAQGPKVEEFLANSVVLLDPMINPDGIARFAQWVNSNKSASAIADPNDLEHNEQWPNGRTNHYWFDLNRDWLLVQHPESKARIKAFQAWKPLVLTDFHEMGTNSTYFFQPGVPSRQNPKTPEKNFDLTARIAEFHGDALDGIGSSYYSKEGFDDFYYGKGSTYPDINGSIGILFEQASARGHRQDSDNGVVTFPFAVRNQLTASFSTLKAVNAEKSALMDYQKSFYSSAIEQADDAEIKGYVFDADGDITRLNSFLDLLQLHNVRYYQLSKDITVKGRNYKASEAYIVPTKQAQFRLIRTLFETETSFKDETFYDVSSWTLALAYNLDFAALDGGDYSARFLGKSEPRALSEQIFVLDKKAVALVFDWRDFKTAQLTGKLLNKGIRLKVATKPATFVGLSGKVKVEQGSIVLTIGSQAYEREQLAQLLGDILNDTKVSAEQIVSGLAESGIDLGSPSMESIEKPRPLLLVGDDVRPYDAGEVWHFFDQRLEVPLVRITKEQLASISLHKYTHLYMVAGSYNFSHSLNEKLFQWIKEGGQLVVNRTAGRWLAEQDWSPIEKVTPDSNNETTLTYAQRDDYRAKQLIGGAILKADIDTSHPLAFGLERKTLPVFRRGTDVFRVKSEEVFATVGRYNETPLYSGYVSKDNQALLANTSNIVAVRKGRGGIIYYADNMNFRAFWWGTAKMFSNSLYFANAYRSEK
ncbi:MAG: hypothetical protein HWE27_04365 [Gammaproteobacteria bacterium]|nr:hypothetical protein [Gammaproteobacteria bacterium]